MGEKKKQETQKTPHQSKKPKDFNYTVGGYAVQCGKCFKWRSIPTKEEFETIRHSFIEDPWYCNKNPDVSCDDPGDLEYDTSRIWIIDKPNVPKPPDGTDRQMSIRKHYVKTDVFYIMPNGRRVRAPAEVEKFLKENPQYKDKMKVSDFNFGAPKIMDPRNAEGKGLVSGGKKRKASEVEDD